MYLELEVVWCVSGWEGGKQSILSRRRRRGETKKIGILA